MHVSIRFQENPESTISGNVFLSPEQNCTRLRYVVAAVDGIAVGQRAIFFRGEHWYVDHFFIAKPFRGTEVSRELRRATYRELAKETDSFRAWIAYSVTRPERVLEEPGRRELGIEVTLVAERKVAALYHFSGLQRAFP